MILFITLLVILIGVMFSPVPMIAIAILLVGAGAALSAAVSTVVFHFWGCPSRLK